jgi:hypothetical protein
MSEPYNYYVKSYQFLCKTSISFTLIFPTIVPNTKEKDKNMDDKISPLLKNDSLGIDDLTEKQKSHTDSKLTANLQILQSMSIDSPKQSTTDHIDDHEATQDQCCAWLCSYCPD